MIGLVILLTCIIILLLILVFFQSLHINDLENKLETVRKISEELKISWENYKLEYIIYKELEKWTKK